MQESQHEELGSIDPNEKPLLNESDKSSVNRHYGASAPSIGKYSPEENKYGGSKEIHHYNEDGRRLYKNDIESKAQRGSLREDSQPNHDMPVGSIDKLRSQSKFNNLQLSPMNPSQNNQSHASMQSSSLIRSLKPSVSPLQENEKPNEKPSSMSPSRFIEIDSASSPENPANIVGNQHREENAQQIPAEQNFESPTDPFLPFSELDEARRLNGIPKEHDDNHSDASDESHEESPKLQLFSKHKLVVRKPNGAESKPKPTALDVIKKSLQNKQQPFPVKPKDPEPLSVSLPVKKFVSRPVEEIKQEIKQEPAIQRNEQNEQIDQEDPKFHSKYTVLEDIKLLDYIKSKRGANPNSRSFWQKAVEKDKVLNQKRSVESLRERYRKQLSILTEEDIEQMRKWVSEHKERGYITFKTITIQNPSGVFVRIKKLDTIDKDTENKHPGIILDRSLGAKDGQALKLSWPSKSPEAGNKKKVEVSKHQNGFKSEESPLSRADSRGQNKGKKSPASLLDSDSIDNAEDERLEEKVFTKSFKKRSPESIKVHEPQKFTEGLIKGGSPSKTFYQEAKEDEIIPKQKAINPVKRKEYASMHQVNESAMPRKMNIENPKPQKETKQTTEEYDVKGYLEDWIQLQAEKHGMSSDEITELFYKCSMNSTTFARVLEGERDLAWNEDEDALLRGTQKEAAKRVLEQYKGATNVKQREEFLEKVNKFSSMLHHNPRQQKPDSKSKLRDFL